MQVHREQAEALEPKTLGAGEGDRECEQDEDMPVRPTHYEPSKLWGKEHSQIRTCVGT